MSRAGGTSVSCLIGDLSLEFVSEYRLTKVPDTSLGLRGELWIIQGNKEGMLSRRGFIVLSFMNNFAYTIRKMYSIAPLRVRQLLLLT